MNGYLAEKCFLVQNFFKLFEAKIHSISVAFVFQKLPDRNRHMKEKIIISVAILVAALSNALGDHHKNNSHLSRVEGVWIEEKFQEPEHFKSGFYKIIAGGEHRVLAIKDGILQWMHGGSVSYDGKILTEKPHYSTKGNDFPGQTLTFSVERKSDYFDQKGIPGSGSFEELSEKWNKVGDSEDSIEGSWIRELDNGRIMVKIIVDNFWQWVAVNPATTEVTASLGGSYSLEEGVYTETTHFRSKDNANWELGSQWQVEAKVSEGKLHFSGENQNGNDFVETWEKLDHNNHRYQTITKGRASILDFQRWCNAHQGLWMGEVTSVIGEDAFGTKKGSYTAYWQFELLEGGRVGSSRFSGNGKSGVGHTYYDPAEQEIVQINISSDGTIARSTITPDGSDWARQTTHTKPDGDQSQLSSNLTIDEGKGNITILISGKVGNEQITGQKNVWHRQHR